MRTAQFKAAVPWLLGFALAANVYLVPGAAGSPRLMDLAGLALTAWLLWRLAVRALPAPALAALALLAAGPAVWGGIAVASGQTATLLMSARWLLAVPWACALVMIASEPLGRRRLVWGLWWGLAANVVVLLAQQLGLFDLTWRVGLAASDSVLTTLDEFWRYPGLHGHANASGAVASLVAPVGLYLYLREGARTWVPLASALLLLASGHITSSRSPLLIAALTIVALLLATRQTGRALRLTGLLGALVLPLVFWLGPPGGQIRWEDEGNIAVNRAERLASNRLALHLVAEKPLGRGVEATVEAVEDALDIPSTHNAFLQTAAVFGLPTVLWVALLLAWLALQLLRGPATPRLLESALALQTIGLFFFEEHANNPTFIVLIAWLVAAAVSPARSSAEAALP